MKRLFFLIFLFICPSAWATNYCTDGNTAAAWKLDDTSGSYSDCTSNGNTGTITGTINQSATLKFGNAAGFTNVNNTNIDFGSATVVDNLFDGGGTVAFWVGLNSAGTASNRCTGSELISKDGANDGWGVCINSDGSIKFSDKWAGGFVDWTSTTTPFSAFGGTAHHVLIYYNSNSTSNNPTVLFDCSSLTMTQGGTAPFSTRNTDATLNLKIGLTGVDDGEMDGNIDEIIAYKGDLTGSCSALSTNGIDGTHGSGGSGSISTGLILNGVTLNGFTGN